MLNRFISKITGKSGQEKPTDASSSVGTTVQSETGSGHQKRRRRRGGNKHTAATQAQPPSLSQNSQEQLPQTKQKPTAKTPAASQPAWDASQFEVPPEAGKSRFHDFDLPVELMHAISDLGFRYCSPIQARSLPLTLRGGDVVGKAQTGTGKTAAFLITVIHDLLSNPVKSERYAGEARAVVLAPTRELALQIAEDAKALTQYCPLEVHALVGGMDYQKQKQHLHSRWVDILVATPGRLMDFMDSRDVYLDEVECLVIDEADRMLDMGFIPQVKRIVRATPMKENRQTLLFSATFNQDVLNLAAQWTCQPAYIEIEPESLASERVDQRVYMVSSEEKFTLLMNLLQQQDVQSLIVFANRRDICRDLFEKLQACRIPCGMLSGDVEQAKRVRTLEQFRSGQLRVLVATDVAGRGIHVDGISHVVNYTLPEEPDDYVHRIGRTGRAGASGVSISFACEDDGFLLPAIENLLGRKLPCEVPPVGLTTPLAAEDAARVQAVIEQQRAQRRAHHRSGGASAGGGRRGGGGGGGSGFRRSHHRR